MTEAIEHYAPILSDEELPERLTPKQLLRDLRTFAYNNPSFRAGLTDGIEIYSGDSERCLTDNPAEEYATIGYQFLANRLRSQAAARPELLFSVAVLATRHNIALPAHIAMDAYGTIDPATAVEQGGPSKLHRRLCYGISTFDRSVNFSESYAYYDADGLEISNKSLNNQDLYVAVERFTVEVGVNDEEDYAEDEAEVELVLPDQRHDDLETIPDITEEEAEQLWDQLLILEEENFTEDDRAAQADEYLRQAFSAFILFKRGLRQQLGLADG